MSIHAIKWAWGQQCPNPTAKLVLVALADHANADGECWPTMKSVAELAGVSQRSVHDHIKALEAAGLVHRGERRMHRGQFRGWTFRLPVASGSTPPVEDDRQRQQAATASGSTPHLPVAADCRSGTVSEPSVEPSVVRDLAEESFQEFWDAYPQRRGKKRGKGNALVEWRKLTEAQRERALIGARNLASSDEWPKDAERFLRRAKGGKGDFPFDDWQEPADTSGYDDVFAEIEAQEATR